MFYVLPPKEITALQNKKRDDIVHSALHDDEKVSHRARHQTTVAIAQKCDFATEVDKPSVGVNSSAGTLGFGARAYEGSHRGMGVSSSEASLCTTMVDVGRGKSYTRKAAACVQRAVRAIRGPTA